MVDQQEELAQVLRRAKQAHGEAFVHTDGEDPEWPEWYAEHMLEEVRMLLDLPGLSRQTLAHALASLDEEHRRQASSEPWWRFYARSLPRELRTGDSGGLRQGDPRQASGSTEGE